MIEYRDRLVREWNLQLVVGMNKAVLEEGRTYPNGRATRVECCGWLKKDGLQQVIEHYGYTGVIVGVRRDEDPTRAKERYFSPRNANMEWNASDQPPEFWNQFKTDFAPGTHIRIHPLLHWTELNVWEYIQREKIPVIPALFRRRHRPPLSLARVRAVHVPDSIQSQNGGRDRDRAEGHQDLRARRARAGPGKRRRLREAPARWLHVMTASAIRVSCGSSWSATWTTANRRSSAGSSTTPARCPDGKYEQLVAIAQRRGVPFEFANLMDGLQAERDQNITIDTAQIWFRTQQREYVIIDAPGHKEFVKNMVTGASRADAALIIIDASEGVQEQTRRHGYLLRLIGVRQVVVVVNKMDLVGYSQAVFDKVSREYGEFLSGIGVAMPTILPVSARQGDNIAAKGEHLKWFTGPTVLQALDAIPDAAEITNQPLRFPIQDVYRFDHRRILAGRIEAGTLKAGDQLLFLPSGRTSVVRSIESWNTPQVDALRAGRSGRRHAGRSAVRGARIDCRAPERRAQPGHRIHRAHLLARPHAARRRQALQAEARDAGSRVRDQDARRSDRCIHGSHD